MPGRGGAWILATYETQVWRCIVACIICWCIHILGMACKALLKGIAKVLPSHACMHGLTHWAAAAVYVLDIVAQGTLYTLSYTTLQSTLRQLILRYMQGSS